MWNEAEALPTGRASINLEVSKSVRLCLFANGDHDDQFKCTVMPPTGMQGRHDVDTVMGITKSRNRT